MHQQSQIYDTSLLQNHESMNAIHTRYSLHEPNVKNKAQTISHGGGWGGDIGSDPTTNNANPSLNLEDRDHTMEGEGEGPAGA